MKGMWGSLFSSCKFSITLKLVHNKRFYKSHALHSIPYKTHGKTLIVLGEVSYHVPSSPVEKPQCQETEDLLLAMWVNL